MIDIILVLYAVFMTFFIFNALLFGFIGVTSIYYYLNQIRIPEADYTFIYLSLFFFVFLLWYSGNLNNFIVMFSSIVFELFILYIVYKALVMFYEYLYPKEY